MTPIERENLRLRQRLSALERRLAMSELGPIDEDYAVLEVQLSIAEDTLTTIATLEGLPATYASEALSRIRDQTRKAG